MESVFTFSHSDRHRARPSAFLPFAVDIKLRFLEQTIQNPDARLVCGICRAFIIMKDGGRELPSAQTQTFVVMRERSSDSGAAARPPEFLS